MLHLSNKLCYRVTDGDTLMSFDLSVSSQQGMYRFTGRCLTLKFTFVPLTDMSSRGLRRLERSCELAAYSPVVTICTAQWSLNVPHSGHYMYRTVVTICIAQWSLYVPHSGHYMYRTVARTKN